MSFSGPDLPPQGDRPVRHFCDPPPQPTHPHFPEATLHPNWLPASDFNNLPSSAAAAVVTAADSNSAPPPPDGSETDVLANIQWLCEHSNTRGTKGDVLDGVNGGAETISGGGDDEGGDDWRSASYKAEILDHPMYEQLLATHVACLRIATPVDQLQRIDAQLGQSHAVTAKYSGLCKSRVGLENKELDHFMMHYVLLLCSFKEQLQHHVRVHAMEAIMACWEIEQSLQSLTGASAGESNGTTMSDDDEDNDQVQSEVNPYDGSLDSTDYLMGFGPLVPTERERSLMERVRQELKHELKQGFKEKIVDIREEILRKRRAGKLPGDTTSVLKAWWQAHSKWPYPTEEEKAKLVQETGLQLKQINNWFINQRKRNWHSNSSSSSVLSKNKRRR